MKNLIAAILLSLTLHAPAEAQEETPPAPEAPYPGAQEEGPTTRQKKYQVKQVTIDDQLEKDDEIIEGTKFRGVKKVKNPHAKEGLYRITTKGEYLYKVPQSPLTRSASVKFGTYFPKNLANDNGIYFDKIYSENSFILLGDYEWRLMSGFTRFGLKIGSGLFFANGNGRFADGSAALEGYTLMMFPNTISGILYLQFWDRQPLIPYAEGGADINLFNEMRDDNKPPLGRFGGSLEAHVAAGVMVPLSLFDRKAMIRMDQEYGINNVYISAEYRIIQHIAGRFDFSSQFFNGGVVVEF